MSYTRRRILYRGAGEGAGVGAEPYTPAPHSAAYVILHFGGNPAYLEMEMYLLCNLYIETADTRDIVYLYAQDTPPSFVQSMACLSKKIARKHACRNRIVCIAYDDTDIITTAKEIHTPSVIAEMCRNRASTANISKDTMRVVAMNMARTCGIINAFILPYTTVCIVESDIVIVKPYDSVFEIPAPAIFVYPNKNVNGGVIRIDPCRDAYTRGLECMRKIVTDPVAYVYPSESLFMMIYPDYAKHAIPLKYNAVRRNRADISTVMAIHFSETVKLLTYAEKYNYTKKILTNQFKYWEFDNILCGLDYFFTHLVGYKRAIRNCMVETNVCVANTNTPYIMKSQPFTKGGYFDEVTTGRTAAQETRKMLVFVRDTFKRNRPRNRTRKETPH